MLLGDRVCPGVETFRGARQSAPPLLYFRLEAFVRAGDFIACADGGTTSEPARLLVGAGRVPHIPLCVKNCLPVGYCRVYQRGGYVLTDSLRVLLSGVDSGLVSFAFGRVCLPEFGDRGRCESPRG